MISKNDLLICEGLEDAVNGMGDLLNTALEEIKEYQEEEGYYE